MVPIFLELGTSNAAHFWRSIKLANSHPAEERVLGALPGLWRLTDAAPVLESLATGVRQRAGRELRFVTDIRLHFDRARSALETLPYSEIVRHWAIRCFHVPDTSLTSVPRGQQKLCIVLWSEHE